MKNLVIKKVLRICVAIYTISSAIYVQQPMITNPYFTEDFGEAENANQKLPLAKGERFCLIMPKIVLTNWVSIM